MDLLSHFHRGFKNLASKISLQIVHRLLADTSYMPPQESRDCLKPVSCHRNRANFSNANKRFRPIAVLRKKTFPGSTGTGHAVSDHSLLVSVSQFVMLSLHLPYLPKCSCSLCWNQKGCTLWRDSKRSRNLKYRSLARC